MDNFWSSAISGALGGVAVLAFQKLLEKGEKYFVAKRQRTLDPTKTYRTLPKEILIHLENGQSLEKVREILGTPNSVYVQHEKFDDEESPEHQVFRFQFTNGIVIVSSVDRLVVSSITVLSDIEKPSHILIFPNKHDVESYRLLGASRIDASIVEQARETYNLATMVDGARAAVRASYGRYGGYLEYFYIVDHVEKRELFWESESAENLLGSVITGFCNSSSGFCPVLF